MKGGAPLLVQHLFESLYNSTNALEIELSKIDYTEHLRAPQSAEEIHAIVKEVLGKDMIIGSDIIRVRKINSDIEPAVFPA